MKINNPLSLFFVFCVLASTYGFSQSKRVHQPPLPLVEYNSNVQAPLTAGELAKIQEVYGDQTESLILSKPQRLKDVKNILRNRIVYQEMKVGENLKECPMLSTVPLFNNYVPTLSRDVIFNKETFNPLKYSFGFHSRSAFMYKVDNANYYIFIKSQHQKN
jgi:hypothetical protein